MHSASLCKELNDGSGGLFIGVEALANGLDVVVTAETAEASLLHGGFVAVKEENELHSSMLVHDLVPTLEVVRVAGETIDEEAGDGLLGSSMLLHSSTEELDRDLNGDNLAFVNVVVNEIGVLASSGTLFTKEVASRKVGEAEIRNNASAHSALASTRTTQHKRNLELLQY